MLQSGLPILDRLAGDEGWAESRLESVLNVEDGVEGEGKVSTLFCWKLEWWGWCIVIGGENDVLVRVMSDLRVKKWYPKNMIKQVDKDVKSIW